MILLAAGLALLWLAWLVLAVRFARTAPSLEGFPDPAAWPRLSVIVPARDEARTLGAAAAKLLAVDYPALQVVLVDDRSTDGTGAIADGLARDPRVTAVHVKELPAGWLGKLNALQRGVEAARGELLLLMDADVHLAADALRRAVASLEARRLDHLAVLPRMLPTTLLVDAALGPLLRGFLPILGNLRAIEDPRSSTSIGVGAFNLVRRAALEASPGLSHLRLEVADDVALAQMLKTSGARSSYALGGDRVSLHYYPRFRDMMHGTEKIPGALGGGRLWPLLPFAAALLAMEAGPFALLLAPGARALAAVACLACVATSLVTGVKLRRPLLPMALVPLGGLLAAALIVRSGVLAVARGGLRWRDTTYSLRELRQGTRVHVFPRRVPRRRAG